MSTQGDVTRTKNGATIAVVVALVLLALIAVAVSENNKNRTAPVANYSSIADTTASPTAYQRPLTLIYSAPRWERSSPMFYTIHFEIKNTSSVPLEWLRVETSFYNAADVLITSETPYADRLELGPGQRMPMKVLTEYDSNIKSARFVFLARPPGSLEPVIVSATEVQKIP